MAFKACPKCQGDVIYERDQSYQWGRCLQCGREWERNWKPDPTLHREPLQIAQGTYADDAKI